MSFHQVPRRTRRIATPDNTLTDFLALLACHNLVLKKQLLKSRQPQLRAKRPKLTTRPSKAFGFRDACTRMRGSDVTFVLTRAVLCRASQNESSIDASAPVAGATADIGLRLQSKLDVSKKRDKGFAMHKSRERTAPSTVCSTYSTSQIWPSIRRYIVSPHAASAQGALSSCCVRMQSTSRATADRVASKNEPRNHHSMFAQLKDPKITSKLSGGSHGKTSGCCQHLICCLFMLLFAQVYVT